MMAIRLQRFGGAFRNNIRIQRDLDRPDADLLRRIAAQIDAGRLKTFVSNTCPLTSDARAHRRLEEDPLRGQMILAAD